MFRADLASSFPPASGSSALKIAPATQNHLMPAAVMLGWSRSLRLCRIRAGRLVSVSEFQRLVYGLRLKFCPENPGDAPIIRISSRDFVYCASLSIEVSGEIASPASLLSA